MSSKLIVACIAITLVSGICLAAPLASMQILQARLECSGENRADLETALRKVKGKDTEYLITHASQYDLVNLTAEMIIENVTYARKVHVALPYLGLKLDDELWRDWVLPSRVLEEDVSLWRKELYEMMSPLVKNLKTTAEAAEVIHDWLLVPGITKPQLVFGQGGEINRKRTPTQLLKSGSASCGELCLIYVYLLRAVGIPARHCAMGRDNGHFYCEYWDPQLKQWTAVDASNERKLNWKSARERVAAGEWKALAMYAYPSYAKVRDPYGTALFDECINVTEHLTSPRPLLVTAPSDLTCIHASVWKSGTWMPQARGSHPAKGAPSALLLSPCAPKDRPVLLTAIVGTTLYWRFIQPALDNGTVELVRANDGQPLLWSTSE